MPDVEIEATMPLSLRAVVKAVKAVKVVKAVRVDKAVVAAVEMAAGCDSKSRRHRVLTNSV